MKNLSLLLTLSILALVTNVQAQVEPTKKSSTQSRSAKTGQYVTKSYADKHPSTTYTSKKRK